MPIRLLVALGLLAASAGALAAQTAAPSLQLRPGDAVRLQVEDEPGLAGVRPVTEDGTVLLPLVGVVPVAGRPFEEVRDAVRALYRVELPDAAVLVTAVLRIPVLGEVRSPGLVQADPTFVLADVLAAAGGLGPDADAGRIDLVRGGTARRVSLAGASGEAFDLRSGDQIHVGRLGWGTRNLPVILSAAGSVVAAVLTSLILR